MNVTATNTNWRKLHYILFIVPYIIGELLVLTNVFTNWAFYIDDNLIYHRGILMPLLYGIGGFYVLAGFIFFIINKKAISKVDNIAVGVFIICDGIAFLLYAVNNETI